jgi:hypothetical protein
MRHEQQVEWSRKRTAARAGGAAFSPPATHLHHRLLQLVGLSVLLHALKDLEAKRQRLAAGGAAAEPRVLQDLLRRGPPPGVLLLQAGRAGGAAQGLAGLSLTLWQGKHLTALYHVHRCPGAP